MHQHSIQNKVTPLKFRVGQAVLIGLISASMLACSSNTPNILGSLSGTQTSESRRTPPATQPSPANDDKPFTLPLWFVPICTVGSTIVIERYVRPAAEKYGKSRNFSKSKIQNLEWGLSVALGFVGCSGLKSFTDSVFAKFNDDDKKAMTRILQESAASGRPATYTNPESGVKFSNKPSAKYQNSSGQNCRDQEVNASHGKQADSVLQPFCEVSPNVWKQSLVGMI